MTIFFFFLPFALFSDEAKQQIAFILEKISALRPAEKLLLYLKMPGGHSEVGESRRALTSVVIMEAIFFCFLQFQVLFVGSFDCVVKHNMILLSMIIQKNMNSKKYIRLFNKILTLTCQHTPKSMTN